MQLPSEAQLSKEQRETMLAKTQGISVVVGPPGSGKTVIAIFRANKIRNRGDKVESLVYNQVLSRFTATDSTFYVWIGKWWKKVTGSSHPQKWIPHSRWRFPDFIEMRNYALAGGKSNFRENGTWGHVIIDEAQDFPKECHSFMSAVQNNVFEDLPDKAASLMILADENQRITTDNSTIEEILDCYIQEQEDVYTLKKNYRNTHEIAEFASRFYVGLSSGIPEFPEERRGEKPRLTVTGDVDEAVAKITTFVKNHDNQEIGVLVQYDNTRQKLYNKLEHRLPDGIRVQSYSSNPKHKGNFPAEDLAFDKKGVVTILCFASAKGLEFDSVFLPELQTLRVDAASSDTARMLLYVMCSRARTYLELMVTDRNGQSDVWEYLPAPSDDLLVFTE
jgi:DNA helicase II / ATP-dependent DNA helicase PcrA